MFNFMPMKNIDTWLQEYGVSHQNPTNKAIHWVCVPVIMFSLLGLLWAIPMPAVVANISPFINVATIFALVTLFFYIRLSVAMALGFIIVGGAMLLGVYALSLSALGNYLWLLSIALFTLAWIGQFIGHQLEGAKPSFFKDLQFLLIGPAWLMHFMFKKMGVAY
jgi:uncharacterized membrane protein YGL010W